jgi:ferredoxin
VSLAQRPDGPVSARLRVDWVACDGRGLCVELLPELLDRDEWGYPLARDGTPEPAVPAGLVGHARRAVGACPKLALRLLAARADRGPHRGPSR